MVVQWVFTGFSRCVHGVFRVFSRSSHGLFKVFSVQVLTVFARGACGVRTGLPVFSLVLLAFSRTIPPATTLLTPSFKIALHNGETKVV